MAKILLDTNVILWAIFETKLSPKNLELISQSDEVFVSSLSILEIRIKQEAKKLPLFDIVSNIELMGVAILPFEHTQAEGYQLYNTSNKDPFDNALISIAIERKLALLTSDLKILSVKHPRLRVINTRD